MKTLAVRSLMASAILTCSVFTAHAQVQFFTGNDLLNRMESDNNFRSGIANGYVIGVIDTLTGITVCPPAGITIGQANDIILKYLRDNPSNRHIAADVIIDVVMSARFPCRNSI
jgi:hypothetical protein